MKYVVEFDVYSQKLRFTHVKMNFDSLKEAKEFVGNFKLNKLKIYADTRQRPKKQIN